MARILVVDDAAFIRMRVVKLLAAQGHEVAEAENGRDAVKKYGALRPDLVLMDIVMPLMDGITATREIKMQDPVARVVVVSALGQQTMVMEAIRAGARDFVVKPFAPATILQTVERHLQP